MSLIYQNHQLLVLEFPANKCIVLNLSSRFSSFGFQSNTLLVIYLFQMYLKTNGLYLIKDLLPQVVTSSVNDSLGKLISLNYYYAQLHINYVN